MHGWEILTIKRQLHNVEGLVLVCNGQEKRFPEYQSWIPLQMHLRASRSMKGRILALRFRLANLACMRKRIGQTKNQECVSDRNEHSRPLWIVLRETEKNDPFSASKAERRVGVLHKVFNRVGDSYLADRSLMSPCNTCSRLWYRILFQACRGPDLIKSWS